MIDNLSKQSHQIPSDNRPFLIEYYSPWLGIDQLELQNPDVRGDMPARWAWIAAPILWAVGSAVFGYAGAQAIFAVL